MDNWAFGWEAVGAIAGLAALMLFILVEWDKIAARFAELRRTENVVAVALYMSLWFLIFAGSGGIILLLVFSFSDAIIPIREGIEASSVIVSGLTWLLVSCLSVSGLAYHKKFPEPVQFSLTNAVVLGIGIGFVGLFFSGALFILFGLVSILT